MPGRVDVEIFGQVYTVRGDKDPDYVRKVAEFVDRKMREISQVTETVSTSRIAILASLNIADELMTLLEEAEQLFQQDAALFLDARPRAQYAEGHIRGALSLPWQEVDRYFVEIADQLDDTAMVITYCDGESCDLSHELALFLREMGFENPRVLVNGWTLWQQAGLPTNMGEMMTP